jgi:hypothetical protein
VLPDCLCGRLNSESNVSYSKDVVDETYGKILKHARTHAHTESNMPQFVSEVYEVKCVCADCAERLVTETNLSLSSSGSLGLQRAALFRVSWKDFKWETARKKLISHKLHTSSRERYMGNNGMG